MCLQQITVVVTIYNTEKYLEKTLRHLASQSIFSKLKIILIDNNSKDNSFSIAKKFSSDYSNMYLYNCEKQGLPASRNYGLQHVDTPFFCFLDGDDLVDRRLYETLLNMIENHDSDISVAEISFMLENGKIIRKAKKVNKILHGKEIVKTALLQNYLDMSVFPKLYRTETFKEIRFDETLLYAEDIKYSYETQKKAHKVIIDTGYVGMYYCIHNASMVRNKFDTNFFLPVEKILPYIIDDIDAEFKEIARAKLIHEKLKLIHILNKTNAKEKYLEKYHCYLEDVKRYSISSGIKYLRLSIFLSLMLMKISPKLYLKFKKF